MGYTKEREQFIANVVAEGLPLSVVRIILAKANRLQVIAELECSSEAADRDRVPCPGKRIAEDCICDMYEGEHTPVMRIEREEARIKMALDSLMMDRAGFKLKFQGDPRGAVVKLAVPSGRYDDMSREGLCVPSRGLPASFWNRAA